MEQLVFFIVFIFIGIAQFLYRWFSARARQHDEKHPQPSRLPAPVAAPRPRREPDEAWDEEREWEERQRREAAERQRREAARGALPLAVVRAQDVPSAPPRTPASVPAARRRASSSRPFASHTDVRRAIVLMEILGPCRGVRPISLPRDD